MCIKGRVLPWAKRQAGLSARIHQLRLAESLQKMRLAINSAIRLTLPFITYYLPIEYVLLFEEDFWVTQ